MDSAETLAAGYLSQNRSIDIGSCVSRGINLVTGNLGLVVGAFVLGFVVIVGIGMVPILGWIASFFVDPAIIGGMYLILLKRLRGQEAAIADVFSGFSSSIMQFALAGIVTGILVSIGFLLLVLPGIYLAVSYVFTLALIGDKQLEFWTAMEVSRRVVTQHWFTVFALMIVAALLAMLGLIALLIGFLVTAPVALAALAVAYEDLFGDRHSTAPVVV
jgi:hypothetical protein